VALDENTKKLLRLMFSYDAKRTDAILDSGRLLAHYTTADTAMKILTNRCLWLRNAAVMNDYSEVAYGRDVIAPVMSEEIGDRLFAILDSLKAGLSREFFQRHTNHVAHARETVFMSSLCEHDKDDTLGRLSMWRAYGGPVAGVALIFKNSVITTELEIDLNVNASPVLYGHTPDFRAEFTEMVEKLEAEKEFLGSLDPDLVLNCCSTAMQMATLSIKHPGFAEEQEWRLIHRPYEYASAHVVQQTITLGGIPQFIYEVPFHNPDKGPLFDLPQLDLKDILAGIIIGPCLYPETVFRAFRDQLVSMGFETPIIHVSNIPLRQQW
jgi:hypothetical protein